MTAFGPQCLVLMNGWVKKKRARLPPPAPTRKPRFARATKKMERQQALDMEDDDWLLNGGPAPAEAPPCKLTCTPPSSEDEHMLKPSVEKAATALVENAAEKATVEAAETAVVEAAETRDLLAHEFLSDE